MIIFIPKKKKIDIPLHFIAKFHARLYTVESEFYYRINKYLTNKKFYFYRIYIFLSYNGLHKKTLKNYSLGKLYRGNVLSKKEYQRMKDYLKNKNENSLVLYYLINFASFSKDEKIALNFMARSECKNHELIYVKYFLDENEDENFFVANIDLETIRESPEKEVCFLPYLV